MKTYALYKATIMLPDASLNESYDDFDVAIRRAIEITKGFSRAEHVKIFNTKTNFHAASVNYAGVGLYGR